MRRVSCIPSADATFCKAATAALAEIDEHLRTDAVGPLLADRLRAEYPLVEVHDQHPLDHAEPRGRRRSLAVSAIVLVSVLRGVHRERRGDGRPMTREELERMLRRDPGDMPG
jgi:hypothetical protein